MFEAVAIVKACNKIGHSSKLADRIILALAVDLV